MTLCKFPTEPDSSVDEDVQKKKKSCEDPQCIGNIETATRSGWKYISQQKCVIRRQTVDVFP